MKGRNDIHLLVQKFMNGETSLAEERILYDYFSGTDIAEDLLPLRDLFLGLESLGSLGTVQEKPVPRPARIRRRKSLRWLSAIAATFLIALLVTGGFLINRRQNYSEAFIYGQKITDPTIIHQEMANTMRDIGIENSKSVDSQLHEVFMTEN